MYIFIYLHGFNSSSASAKGRTLTRMLAPAPVLIPEYPPDPDTAVEVLQKALNKARARPDADTVILIGSSLGGFYAQYLARRFDLPAVLINPALQPEITLKPYLGWQTNIYTGERYRFEAHHLAQFGRYAVSQPCDTPVPSLILLDAGDELIDFRLAAQRYSQCGEVIVYPGGDHAFQHLPQSVSVIRDFARKMRTRPQI